MKDDGVVMVEFALSHSVMKRGYIVIQHSVKQGERYESYKM